MSSVGSFFSYVNDARSHEPEINFDILNYALSPGLTLLSPSLVGLFTGLVHIVNYFDVSGTFIMSGMSEE